MNSLRGRVVDDAGRDVAGAWVHLTAAAARSDSGTKDHTVKTDEDGGFSFEGIADGPYTVKVFGFEDPDAGQYHLPGETITIRVERGGVITGRVTNSDGEPVIGAQVLAKCIRGKGDKPLASPFSYEFSRSRLTDDRGIYRFWGLQPGMYIVSAGPSRVGLVTPYDDDSPTYYPSSTLGSATKLTVNSGQELTGIDINYRGFAGHAIGGSVTGNIPPSNGQVYLATMGGDYVDSIWLEGGQESGSFTFAKVSDGDYLLIAVRTSRDEVLAISSPKAVTMKGGDVTGVNLKPVPLGSLSGRIRPEFEPTLDCKNKTNNTPVEIVLSLRSDKNSKDHYPLFLEAELSYKASPDSKGNFVMKRVPAGDYLIDSWLPNEDWYVAATDLGASAIGASATGASSTDTSAIGASGTGASSTGAASGLHIRDGQAASGLNVTIKNGAAGLSGRIIPKGAGAALPSGLRVYLTPAEPDRARDRLRFFETEAVGDGSFKFKNLPPGSYRVVARAIKDEDAALATDSVEGRARLLREAEGTNLVVELHPCERRADYLMKP